MIYGSIMILALSQIYFLRSRPDNSYKYVFEVIFHSLIAQSALKSRYHGLLGILIQESVSTPS